MARYYFDIYDRYHLSLDDVGTECRDPDDIKAAIMVILPAIVRDIISKDGDGQASTVLVRNTSNLAVFAATLTFASVWLGEDVLPALKDPDQAGHPLLLCGR